MANKSIALLATVLVIVGLLVGGLFVYNFFPKEVTVTKLVDKVVIKEVPVTVTQIVTKEVPAPSQLDNAVATFMEAVADEEDEAGHSVNLQNGYDFEDISVSKISKDYNVSYTKDTVTVDFNVTLKYDEAGDHDRSVKKLYSVKVTYEDDEDSTVKVL